MSSYLTRTRPPNAPNAVKAATAVATGVPAGSGSRQQFSLAPARRIIPGTSAPQQPHGQYLGKQQQTAPLTFSKDRLHPKTATSPEAGTAVNTGSPNQTSQMQGKGKGSAKASGRETASGPPRSSPSSAAANSVGNMQLRRNTQKQQLEECIKKHGQDPLWKNRIAQLGADLKATGEALKAELSRKQWEAGNRQASAPTSQQERMGSSQAPIRATPAPPSSTAKPGPITRQVNDLHKPAGFWGGSKGNT